MTENNPKLFFNDSNARFGIGTNTPQRHVHLKTHTGYDKSGVQMETFALTTSDAGYDTIYTVTIPDLSVCTVELTIQARITDGSGRASFKRTAQFFRENSDVQIYETWSSDFTYKSESYFDITYSIITDTILFKVKSPVTTDTLWTGNIILSQLVNNV